MSNQPPSTRAETLVSDLERYGQGDYIGESISQLEHCLQAAHQAQLSGEFRPRDLYSLDVGTNSFLRRPG